MKIKTPDAKGDPGMQGNKMLKKRCGPYDVPHRGVMSMGKDLSKDATNSKGKIGSYTTMESGNAWPQSANKGTKYK